MLLWGGIAQPLSDIVRKTQRDFFFQLPFAIYAARDTQAPHITCSPILISALACGRKKSGTINRILSKKLHSAMLFCSASLSFLRPRNPPIKRDILTFMFLKSGNIKYIVNTILALHCIYTCVFTSRIQFMAELPKAHLTYCYLKHSVNTKISISGLQGASDFFHSDPCSCSKPAGRLSE